MVTRCRADDAAAIRMMAIARSADVHGMITMMMMDQIQTDNPIRIRVQNQRPALMRLKATTTPVVLRINQSSKALI